MTYMTYDPDADAAYVYFSRGKIADSAEVAENIVLDYDAKGRLVGIEILSAKKNSCAGQLEQGAPAGEPTRRRGRIGTDAAVSCHAMKLTYDKDHNIAYLRFRPEGGQVDTIRVSDEMNIDIAPDGSVYGIELLNANEQLRATDDGRIVFIDPVSGEERSLKVA